MAQEVLSECCNDQDAVFVQGIATIKTFRREVMHERRLAALMDISSAMQLCNQSMNRWLALRLEIIGAGVSFAAAALAIEQRGAAAWAGLTLSYALQLTALTTMAVRAAPRPSQRIASREVRTEQQQQSPWVLHLRCQVVPFGLAVSVVVRQSASCLGGLVCA